MTQAYSPGDLASLFGSKPVIYDPKPTVGTKRPAIADRESNDEPSKKRAKLTAHSSNNNRNSKNRGNNNDNNSNFINGTKKSLKGGGNDEKIEAFYPNLRLKGNTGRGRACANTRQERRMKHVSKMRHIRMEKKLKQQKGHKLTKVSKLSINELDDRKEKTQRTLFIGNIPNYWKKKHVTKFLSKWSKFIEEIYFSNYIGAKTKYINKQMKNKTKNVNNESFMKNKNNQIAENKSNKNAWIRFKSKQYVNEAISLNNSVINGKFTLRVDFADPSLNRNNDKCVFIGGLPLSANEDDIRNHFIFQLSKNYQTKDSNENKNKDEDENEDENTTTDCIVNVRILRNPQTQISRGCGFIEFDTVNNVSKALDLHLSQFPIPNFDENDNEDELEDDDIENGKRKRKKKPYKIIRVVPCVKNPQQFGIFVSFDLLFLLLCKDKLCKDM